MSSIAEVLARWMFESEWGGSWDDCHESARPGWIRSAEQTLGFLTTAGFGPVKEAGAVALEEAAAVMDKSAETMVAVWAEMPMTAPAAATLSAIRHEARRVRARAAAVRGEG